MDTIRKELWFRVQENYGILVSSNSLLTRLRVQLLIQLGDSLIRVDPERLALHACLSHIVFPPDFIKANFGLDFNLHVCGCDR